jgi:hypothetical protein
MFFVESARGRKNKVFLSKYGRLPVREKQESDEFLL